MSKADDVSENVLNEEAEILRKVIMENLRKNDVYSKCNGSQYVIIIATAKEEGCMKAVDRIVSRYEMKKKHSGVKLLFDIRDIV